MIQDKLLSENSITRITGGLYKLVINNMDAFNSKSEEMQIF